MGIQINGQTDTITASSGTVSTPSNVSSSGVVTATTFRGNLSGSVNATGLSTFSGGIQVGATTSVTVGDTFIRRGAVGLGTTDTTGRNAGIGTAVGTLIYNSFTGAIEVYDGGWFIVKSLFSATGGTVTASGVSPGNGYKYHVFTSPGTFTVTKGSTTVEYLVVGGGGGGGTGTGGGGGAGGVRYGSIAVSPSTSYSVSIGIGATVQTFLNASGNGVPSSFGPIVASGGGRGASGGPSGVVNAASPGGSGGGGSSYPTAVSPAAGTGNAGGFSPVEGFDGGPGPGNNGGAGGGGANGIGGPAPAGVGGAGIPYAAFAYPLIQSEIPAPVQPTFGPAVGATGLYGGGGGGSASPTGGAGGPGGGGPGNTGNTSPAVSGVKYTGGGGGGNWNYSPGVAGGGGGDGIVIVRYSV